ncbi:unnamed protein product [Ectocarpus sp. 12 AP-2014]
MKRGVSDTGAATSPGPSKLQKTSSGSDGDNGGPDAKSILQQQNHELAVDMRRRKRQEAELEKKLAQAWARQGHFDATLSAVNRAWRQVLSDLSTAAGELGLGPRPLNVTVAPGGDDKDDDDDDDDDENKEEGEVIMVSVKDGLSGEIFHFFSHNDTPHGLAGQEPASELSLMQKLIMPAAEVLAMDATEFSCGDRLLKGMGKKPEKSEEAASARERLAGMAGTSNAFYDLDTDGYGLKSRESVKAEAAADIAELDKALKEKARFTGELAGRLFQALQAHLMALPPESRKDTLDKAQLEMVGKKKRLEAERDFLSDELTQARKRCMELSESVTSLRENCRKANRTLDKLAADGVIVEVPSEKGTLGGGRRGSAEGGAAGLGGGAGSAYSVGTGYKRGVNGAADAEDLLAALEEAQTLAETRLKEMERWRTEKTEAERELTQFKASTELETKKADLSGHPQFQRLSTQLEAEQDMLKLEKARVTELEGQIKQMSGQVEQHEMALQQQMEQQRLRWKSEIVSSNSMLNTAHEDLDKAQGKLKHEQRFGSGMLKSVTIAKEEAERLLKQTEQQVSILKASLDRATKAKEHAEAQAAKDRARRGGQGASAGAGGGGGREDENLRAKLADSLRQLEGSKAIEDALQSELNTTLAAYAQSKEGNQKLVQEMTRISASRKELSDEVTSTKAQLKNRAKVRATMELQIKTAMQMRDQGHALKQKALDLVAEAEEKVQHERKQNLELAREVHTEKAHADRARQEVDFLTQTKQAVETAHSALKVHCEQLNSKVGKVEEEVNSTKEQVATLTRRLEKSRSLNAKLVEQVKESAKNTSSLSKVEEEDNEMRDAELGELRKMIKCSVCQDKKKNRVITKCFHMFCDGCLEKSIKSRNRKCPACGKVYAPDDVHELWLT